MTVVEPTFPIRNAPRSAKRALFIVFVVLCVSVPAAIPARTGGEGARLRYRFKPGASYAIVVGLDLAMETQVEGLPPEAAALAEVGKDMKQQSSLKLHLEASAPGADGSQPLTLRVDDAQAKLSTAGRVVRMQGLEERLEGSILLAGTLSSDGRAIELAPRSDADIPDASREIVGLLLQLLPSFPDRELALGESFEVPVQFAAPGMGADVKLETHGTCVYTLRSVAAGRARFDVRAEGTADSSGDPTQKMTMKVDNHGTAEFDLAEGIFTTLRSELSIGLFLDTDLPSSAADPSGTPLDFTPNAPPRKLEVHASAKGPLEFAMVRVPAEAK